MARRSTILVGVLAGLSVAQIDFRPPVVEGSIVSLQFVAPAEARVYRHRPVHHPVHRHPVHRPVHPIHRPGYRGGVVVAPIRPIPGVRPWYWGRAVAGVTIGAAIGVAVAGTVPPAPSPDLCWY